MNTRNFSLSISVVILLSTCCSMVHAVQLASDESQSNSADERNISKKNPKSFAAQEAMRVRWSVAYLRVEADWAKSLNVQGELDAIRKEVYSFATDEEYEDPLPTLPDHVIGQETSGISISSEVFLNRLRWMKAHGVVQSVSVLTESSISEHELSLSGFDEIRKKLAAATDLSWLCRVHWIQGKLEFVRSLYGEVPKTQSKTRLPRFGGLLDLATIAMRVEPSSEVIVFPFFCLSRDRMIRAERTKAGHRDLLVLYRTENSLVQAALEGEQMPGENAELNLQRNPSRLGIIEFRTDGSPEFLASTTLYASWESNASIYNPDSKSNPIPNAQDSPVPRERPSSKTSQNSAAGGSLFHDDIFSGGSTPEGNLRQVSSNGVMITWSEKNDELRGFSTKLGDWEVISIEPQQYIIPIVSDTVAAVRVGDSVAAFSGEKGWWDVIELSKGSKAVPVLYQSHVQIESNGHLYTFASEKGAWTSPTDPELRPANETISLRFRNSGTSSPSNNVRVLENVFEEWRNSLPKYKARGISILAGNSEAHFRTARQSWMPELKDWLHKLFGDFEAGSAAKASVDATTQSRTVADLEVQLETLQVELNALRSAKPETSDAATKQPDKVKLRKQAEQAFDVRQQLQELEAQKLRLKLQIIEANLAARQKNRERIVERRVEQLESSDSGRGD